MNGYWTSLEHRNEQGIHIISRGLHWLLAILMIGLIWVGWHMVGLDYYDKWYHTALSVHRAVGITVLVLAVTALGWRLMVPPGFVPTIRRWERIAASVTHAILYGMMIALPIIGYLISTSAGAPIPMFGWLEVPVWIVVDEATRNTAVVAHYYLAYATALLVIVHILAALKHHFVDRDDTLRRMLKAEKF
uniref:Cytochrome b561 n=1 Tax=Candidatus Kentrum sp. UNK TaxID=2126344 RepID=A0A451B1M2_9GAMM|nr:MAG: Cytochrome b561 [Candidatus Kentron sp. UNK]VFK72180.1 MAG: Cytochrome b561 [Candidatus Kentron sp. UNK]